MSSVAVDRSSTRGAGRALHVALWVAQVVLAVMFAMGGFMKATQPVATLATSIVWANDVPFALLRFIGFAELAAAIGLVLPALTRIKPWLTPLAALGLAVIMLLASIFHVGRGEIEALPINIALGAAALFIAWGRARKAPIAARS